jgi:hypothetical protein
MVASHRLQGTTAFGGLIVYDNGTARRERVLSDAYLIVAASDRLVYAYNNQSTEYGLREIAIDANGARQTWLQQNLISGFGTDIDYVGGRVYSTNGIVVDPSFPKIVGKFPTTGAFAVDVERKEAFVVATSTRIDVFDTETFLLLRRLTIPTLSGTATQMSRIGATGLVIRHDGGLAFTTIQ